MNHDIDMEKIGNVEDGVEYLIELCKEYMGVNEQLKAQIRELEEALRVKREEEARRAEESQALSARVDDIRNRLNAYCDGVSVPESE